MTLRTSATTGPGNRPGSARRWYGPAIFLGAFIVCVLGPSVQVSDSRLAVPTALSIVREGNLDLDEYTFLPELAEDYDVVRVGERHLWYFPYAPALFAIPLVAAADALPGVDVSAWRPSEPNQTWPIEIPTASALVAATALLVFVMARERSAAWSDRSSAVAVLVAAGFVLATPALSSASRALWSSTAALPFVALAVLQAQRVGHGRGRPVVLGATVAAAYVMRPTMAVLVLLVSIWMGVVHRSRLVAYLSGACAVAVPFLLVNLAAYGRVLPPYYDGARLGLSSNFAVALVGHLFSPSRGLFTVTPVLVLSLAGACLAVRRHRAGSLDLALGVVIVGHWLTISDWPEWSGGAAFGPRYWVEVLPVFAYFGVPSVAWCFRAWKGTVRERAVVAAVAAVAVVSMAIHVEGAYLRAAYCWGATPVPVDRAHDRLWDWRDTQPLRGVRRLLQGEGLRQVVLGSCRDDLQSPDRAQPRPDVRGAAREGGR